MMDAILRDIAGRGGLVGELARQVTLVPDEDGAYLCSAAPGAEWLVEYKLPLLAEAMSEASGETVTLRPAPPAEAAPLLALLDDNVEALESALPALDREQVNELMAAETAGKTRKGAMRVLSARLEELADEEAS